MDNEQGDRQGRPVGDRSTAGSPTPASTRQLARNRGLAWVKALTLGAGAAGALGAAAIAATLPGPTATAGVRSTTAASTTAGSSSGGGSAASESSEDNGGQNPSSARQQPAAPRQLQPATPRQLQPAAPPSNTNNPPAATSGGS